MLLRSAAALSEIFGKVRVLVVGGSGDASGSRPAEEERELARLHQIVDGVGLRDSVSFVGAVEQSRLAQYYRAANLTVMPSTYESFGLVAVESLACGTPVVASRVGGLATIVRRRERCADSLAGPAPLRRPHPVDPDRARASRAAPRGCVGHGAAVQLDGVAEQTLRVYDDLLGQGIGRVGTAE